MLIPKRSLQMDDAYLNPALHEWLQSWTKANGVDPADVVAAHPAVVDYNAETITLSVFARNADGTKILAHGQDRGFYHLTRVVPMRVTPEDHTL